MSNPFLDAGDCEHAVVGDRPERVVEFADGRRPCRSLAIYNCEGRDWTVIGQLTALEELAVNPWKHRTFEPLRSLTRLRRLYLNVYGRVTDVSPLLALGRLESLTLNGATYVEDISPLAKLPRLKHLSMHTWVGETVLSSTAQLRGFAGLETLDLNALRFREGSIRDLAGLNRLRDLRLDNRYPIEDCAWLSVALPNTRCLLFSAVAGEYGVECESCARRGVQLIGARRNKFVCPRCHPDAVEKHKARYQDCVLRAQEELG